MSITKESIYEALKSKEITPIDVVKAVAEYDEKDHPGTVTGWDILDTLNGWTVDNEMAVHWGVKDLMKRLGPEKGFIVASEILFGCREQYVKQQKEEWDQQLKTLKPPAKNPNVCSYKNSWCSDVEGCKGTKEEWDSKKTCTGNPCYMEHERKTYKCPQCSDGQINTTFAATLACDKCSFEIDEKEYKQNYIKEEK